MTGSRRRGEEGPMREERGGGGVCGGRGEEQGRGGSHGGCGLAAVGAV